MQTNIAVVMLTLNEADTIGDSLESAWPIFDELVLVDGGSDDGTVEIARDFTSEKGIPFDVLESSEREYLIDGPGCQRRRGEDLVQHCDYTLALGADVRTEIRDEEWFAQEFKHYGYSHTRVKASGACAVDFRLYCPHPPEEYHNRGGEPPRWRGIIHEEILSQNNVHIDSYYQTQEAPMTQYQIRHGAMDTHTIFPFHQKVLDSRVGGNDGYALKKQHYLLKRALGSDMQSNYLSPIYGEYYAKNIAMVNKDWREIREEFDLPQLSWHGDDPGMENNTTFEGWDMSDMTPVMDHHDKKFDNPIVEKAANILLH